MDTFRNRFTRIQEGFSENRRIPRLGRIRLGLKVQKTKENKTVEYPRETDYFVVPPEVQAVYGPQPRELDVMLPSDDPSIVFPQQLAWYGSSKGLRCHGDGVNAERWEEGQGWVPRSCPCEQRKTSDNPKGECTEQAYLMVLLPKVSMGGVYQLTTRSYHSVVDINSGLDYVRALIGRIAMVPLKLRRDARETHHDRKKQVHYTCSLILDADVHGINLLRQDTDRIIQTARGQIEGPVMENPEYDPVDVTANEEPIDDSDAFVQEAEQLTHAKEALAKKHEMTTKKRGRPKKTEDASEPTQETASAIPEEPQAEQASTLSNAEADWHAWVEQVKADPSKHEAFHQALWTIGAKKASDVPVEDRRAFIEQVEAAAKQ